MQQAGIGCRIEVLRGFGSIARAAEELLDRRIRRGVDVPRVLSSARAVPRRSEVYLIQPSLYTFVADERGPRPDRVLLATWIAPVFGWLAEWEPPGPPPPSRQSLTRLGPIRF